MIKLDLIDSEQQMLSKVNAAIAQHINKQIEKNKSAVFNKFKPLVAKWIESQPEIQSLLDQGRPASLNSLFGLYPGQANAAVSVIVDSVVDATLIEAPKIDKNLKGEIKFKFQPANFANLLTLGVGHTITAQGADLHWLDWLLTQGDKIIIIGYRYEPVGRGRSGVGSMKIGGSFRVPPQFSGDLKDNFITRAFSKRESEITKLVSQLLNG